jgi:hypothetical protein
VVIPDWGKLVINADHSMVSEYWSQKTPREPPLSPGFFASGRGDCRSLGYAQDDKGRTATDLYFASRMVQKSSPIRLADS